jgi:phospholipid/cholesterol/gamma-HCH transport system substrate-binding protein
METKANYVLIGAFTIVIAVFGLLFALWAAKYSADKSFQQYYVVFNEPVTGLTEGGSVQYNGISVGTIEELSLDPRDPRQVRARLKLEASAPVKVDTKAKLSQAGLTGSPFIQLTGGSPNAQRLVASSRDDIPVIQTEPSALQNIADTASKLVERVDKLMSEENIRHIENTLTNLDNMTGALGDAAQKEELRALVRNAREASEQLNATLKSANSAVAQVDNELPALLRKLDGTLSRLDSAAGGADAILNENRAAIQSFANDGLAQLGPTLGELRALIRDLRRVTDRLEGSPARYLLGRDAPKEFEPE